MGSRGRMKGGRNEILKGGVFFFASFEPGLEISPVEK